MKIISLQKNLRSAVQAVSHIAQKNVSLPILNNILISARDGILSLITTNLEIGITSALRGKIEVEGAFTVDAKTLSEYVALLAGDKVTVETTESELVINSGSSKTKIKGLGPEEFPLIPVIDRNQAVTINAEDFKEAISRIIFSVSSDESRLELSGVLFSLNGNQLVLAGTDSYRLAEKKLAIKSEIDTERRLIIPARTLQEVLRIISGDSNNEEPISEIKLYASENQCLFVIGSTEIVSRLIDGQYPDYTQIIPTQQQCKAVVGRDEVVRAVKAAAIFSRSGVNDVVFSFSTKNGLEIFAASGTTGEHDAKLEATVQGEDVSMTLNYRYVLDGLNAISSPSVIFEMVNAETPCLLKDENDAGYVYIIMPIKK